MHVRAIINPVAGACKSWAEVHDMLSRVRQAGATVELDQTSCAGHARELARQAAGRADAVIAIGGDGTVCEVANGLIGSPVPLLIWPTGTENLVAHSLGFEPNPTLIQACLRDARPVLIDVGLVNQQSFLVVVGVGFDAEVVERLTGLRRGHITHLSYAGPLWRTFWEHRFPPLRGWADDQLIWEGRGMVFIGNMARYALGLPVLRDARPDDGLLDLCIMNCAGLGKLIGHSIRTVFGRHIEHHDVLYRRVRRVRVESPVHVPFELDGELGGQLPIEVEVRPAAIRVLIPPGRRAMYNPRP